MKTELKINLFGSKNIFDKENFKKKLVELF